ncbi:helix-turn-helix domain-containing protein [uncultured Megasphaera sp.]|uniref:helix-turn-helix domain-containing protein n=1 Tax=uncultured Megasphaera sp. TaxID=165188 RepID=UPI00266D0B3B|nr:helix-turn-helix domain-containing protein [uncultured Megasphaera sp.]
MYIGEFIKSYRFQHGLSMQDFANITGLSKAYIGMLEKIYNPKTNQPISPSLDKLNQIAVGIGISLDDLLKQLDDDQPVIVSSKNDNIKLPQDKVSSNLMKTSTPSERLKELMELKNIRQVDIAEKTGLGKSAISQYVSGKITPKQDKVYLLAEGLNVSPAWLMGYDVPMEKEIPLEKSSEWDKSDDSTLTQKDEREIESDLEDMMNSMAAAAYDGQDDIEDVEAFKATIRAAMIQAKKLAKKKYTPKKYRKD